MESKTEQQCIIQATLDKFNGSTGWTSEAMDKRAMDVQRVLGVLYTMVQDVVREGLFGCNGQQSTLIHSGETVEWCKFYSFGSYRLGVNTLQSDVDVLCIGPNKVARSFFFERLSNRLAQDELCTKKLILTAAIVPVMKIVFDTVELDIVYGELNMAILPASLVLTNDDIFQYCAKDTPTMLSLNGSRVTDKLLELVPSQEVFQTSLRFVKQWAAQRGLVSNSFGFLSGVAWAILTAYVCQRFPTSSAAHIITEFFALYASWPWPRPVSLIDCTTTATKSSRPKCAWASWDAAKNPADAKDVLPVLTPVLPIMNTAQNVSLTTRRILIDEWKRAAHSISASSTSTSWMALLQPQRFLFDFTNYISVTVLARSEADLQTWCEWVEAHMRHVVNSLDRPPEVVLRPWPKRFPTTSKLQCLFLIGFVISLPDNQKTLDLSTPIATFKSRVLESKTFVRRPGMDMVVKHLKYSDLPDHLFSGSERPVHSKKRKQRPGDMSPNAMASPTQSVKEVRHA